MINEFKRVDLACDAAYTVPSNRAGFTGFGNTVTDNTQTCTLQGSTPGQNNVPGMRYLEVAFDYRHGHQWRNFGILIAFFLFFCKLSRSRPPLLSGLIVRYSRVANFLHGVHRPSRR